MVPCLFGRQLHVVTGEAPTVQHVQEQVVGHSQFLTEDGFFHRTVHKDAPHFHCSAVLLQLTCDKWISQRALNLQSRTCSTNLFTRTPLKGFCSVTQVFFRGLWFLRRLPCSPGSVVPKSDDFHVGGSCSCSCSILNWHWTVVTDCSLASHKTEPSRMVSPLLLTLFKDIS